MNQVQQELNEMKDFIRNIYMRDIYNKLRPTAEQQDDEDWWSDTFIQSAVNSDEFQFDDAWFEYKTYGDGKDGGDGGNYEVFVVIEMLNHINKWTTENTGTAWEVGKYTYTKIFKMFAYVFVMSEGIDFWREQKDIFNQYVADMGDDRGYNSDEW